MRILNGLTIAAVSVMGCGGVSEQRVSGIEQQVKKLQETQTAPKEADTAGDATLGTKLTALEASTAERFKKTEDMMELLQRAISEAPASHPVAPQQTDVWAEVDTLLGIEEVGVEVSGDIFIIKRGYLVRELKAMAIGGKGPKLTPAKPAGLSVKAVKPKSLVDKLGIKNGDTLIAVGDVAVNSVEELSAALQKLAKPASSVKLQRKKKDVVLQYTLKD